MARAPRIAIEIGRRSIRALRADWSQGRLVVHHAMVEALPDGVSIVNPQALGEWLGEKLRESGIGRGPVLFALPRELVGLKRLTLPTNDRDELPDMTRMAMQRDLPVDAAGMVIDFVPVDALDASTTVLAVAAPQSLVDSLQQTARAAGLVVSGIGLSAMGAAALVRDAASEPHRSVLAVDVSGESIEITLVERDSIMLSRCGDIPAPGDSLAVAEGVLTEARRTWMSASLAEGAAPIEGVVLLGDQKVCQYAAQSVEQMLGKPVRVLAANGQVVGDGVELDRLWPLAGLLLEQRGDRETINLAQPRRAPDTASARRRRILLAAGVLLVAGMGLYTLANRNLQSLRETATELAAAVSEGAKAEARYSRDTYKLKHLEQWQSAGVDWLEHAEYLNRFAPPPSQLVLDSWTGTLDFNGVQYDSKSRRWSNDRRLTIVIDGEAQDRETADAFREALVKSSVYTTSSTGADAKGGKRMPFGFTYRLRTAADLPQQHAASNAQPPTSEVASR